MGPMSAERFLSDIFAAERSLREAEARLLADSPEEDVVRALEAAVEEAAGLDDEEEAELRLTRLADLCAQVPGPRMADALIAILNYEEPAVRVAAGEALLDVGYERYAELARAIERALERGLTGPAMAELPWLLAELGEASALPLIKHFLDHEDVDVTAAAIESLAQLGDPRAIPALERFRDDPRPVTLDDLDEETTTTLGDLCRESITELSPGD